MITFFNFNNYDNNPIVNYCLSQYTDKQVLTLNDVLPEIRKLRYANWCHENNHITRLGNELRLHLSTLSDDFIYVDSDCIVKNINDLKMDHACKVGKYVNEGSYFRANKNTEWTKFFIDKYETDTTIKDNFLTYVHAKYPYDVPVQELNYSHFYLHKFDMYVDKYKYDNIVAYTHDYHKAVKYDGGIWLFCDISNRITNNHIYHISKELPLDVFKEQIKYNYGRDIIFKEI